MSDTNGRWAENARKGIVKRLPGANCDVSFNDGWLGWRIVVNCPRLGCTSTVDDEYVRRSEGGVLQREAEKMVDEIQSAAIKAYGLESAISMRVESALRRFANEATVNITGSEIRLYGVESRHELPHAVQMMLEGVARAAEYARGMADDISRGEQND